MSSAFIDTVEQVFEALPDVFLEVNARGKTVRCVSGSTDDELLRPVTLVNAKFAEYWPAAAAQCMLDNIRKALRSRSAVTFTVDLSDTEAGRYEVRLFVRGRDRLLAVIRPVHDASQQKPERSFVDTLTGLATRERFLLELENVLADAKLRESRVGLMCIDIDRFTRINETLGRATGDEVLRIAARRIENCFRGRDQVLQLQDEQSAVARVGGDEFLLVLGGISSQDDITLLAKRITESFDEPLQCDQQTLSVTPSIGIALFPRDGTDAESLLASARAGLNQARDFGAISGMSCATSASNTNSRSDLGQELKWALQQNQLELHYLPRFDLRSRSVTAIEALLRWRHPVRGFVPVNEIIPLAETTGLMRQIGEWALVEACVLARSLCDEFGAELGDESAGVPTDAPVVSINLSQREFSRTDLPDLVADTLQGTGLEGHRLQLEFTESALMQNRQSVSMLQRMAKLGVHLAIDDFGTGHFSLPKLRELPIEAVKIDRCFTEGLPGHSDNLSLCSAIIAMCHHLGLTVTADGIEAQEQLAFLGHIGCDAAQGLYFSKPLPASQVVSFLHTVDDLPFETAAAGVASDAKSCHSEI